MKPPSPDASTLSPSIHLEFIQNQMGQPESASLEEIEAYHRALFLHQHSRELDQYTQDERTHRERLVQLEARLVSTQARLSGMESMLPVNVGGEPDIRPSAPWNHWDRAMFGAGILGILSLLVFGVLNVSFNLLESGLVTFSENPVRAYFWAALLPVGALAVKVGWDLLSGRAARAVYLWVCLGLGFAGVLAWLAAYAMVYPQLSRSTSEQLASVSVFDSNERTSLDSTTSAGAKWVDTLTVVSQATAEIFLSAVLGMYLTTLYHRHRAVRLVGNPLFLQLDQERRELEQGVVGERRALAEATGKRSQLENQLTALLLFARSLFHRELRVHQDHARQEKRLLDEIAEQLRSQLDGVEKNRFERREIGQPGGGVPLRNGK